MTAQDYMADQTERMGASLAHFVATTDPALLGWVPAPESGTAARSVLDQIAECVIVNRRLAALLRGDDAVTAPSALTDAREAQEQITASADTLADALRALSDESLDHTFQTGRGPVSGRNLMMAAHRNMAYHAGQINLIQMLAGDAEFHAPPTWL